MRQSTVPWTQSFQVAEDEKNHNQRTDKCMTASGEYSSLHLRNWNSHAISYHSQIKEFLKPIRYVMKGNNLWY